MLSSVMVHEFNIGYVFFLGIVISYVIF